MSEKKFCSNCGGDIAIRNPTGKCDHLYYPELVPKPPAVKSEDWEKELREIILKVWRSGYAWTGNSEKDFEDRVFNPAMNQIKALLSGKGEVKAVKE